MVCQGSIFSDNAVGKQSCDELSSLTHSITGGDGAQTQSPSKCMLLLDARLMQLGMYFEPQLRPFCDLVRKPDPYLARFGCINRLSIDLNLFDDGASVETVLI
jgi:hypothetical protein